MKKVKYIVFGTMLAGVALSAYGCKNRGDNTVRLVVWVSEADRPFATFVAEEFKSQHPNENYEIVIDIQGENDVATRVLNDVENAADVFSCLNDQLGKFINGDALARIAGERLDRIKDVNTDDSMDSVTMKVGGKENVYGMPYTDNTFFLYYDKSVLTATDVRTLDGILSKCSSTKQFAMPFADGWYSTSFYFGKDLEEM